MAERALFLARKGDPIGGKGDLDHQLHALNSEQMCFGKSTSFPIPLVPELRPTLVAPHAQLPQCSLIHLCRYLFRDPFEVSQQNVQHLVHEVVGWAAVPAQVQPGRLLAFSSFRHCPLGPHVTDHHVVRIVPPVAICGNDVDQHKARRVFLLQ